MHYVEKIEVRLGDHLDVGDGATGRVVAILDQAAYEEGYAERDLGYLKSGALVASDELGVVHYPDFISGAPVRLLWRERKKPPLVHVSIFLRGDDLQPGTISERLGVEPDRQQTRGEEHISGGRSMTRRTGLWNIGLEEHTLEIERVVEAVVTRLALVDMDLRTLPGVDDAFLDLFIAEEEGTTHTIELDQAILIRLNELGLALNLTIGG